MALPPRRPVDTNVKPAAPRPTAPRENLSSRFGYQKRTLADVESRIVEASTNYKTYHNPKYKEFKPKDGENCIRILPAIGVSFPKHVSLHYGLSISLHYLMTAPKATVICPLRSPDFKPVHIEDKCPICEEVAYLYSSGQGEKVKTLRIKAAKKVLVWVIDLKDSSRTDPTLFAIPTTLDLEFTKLCKDRSTGEIYNIDSPDEGFNIYFDKTKEFGGTKYVSVSKDQRPSAIDISAMEFVAANPLTSVLTWRGYDELKSLFSGSMTATIGDEGEVKEETYREEEASSEDESSIDSLLTSYEDN